MTDGLSAADVALLNGRNNGMFGGDGIGMLALFFLFSMMGWGGLGGWGGFGRNGEPVTEAGLCNAMNFNNLENAVGRGFDQQAQFAFQNQRDLCTGFASTNAAINQSRFENQNCCCETQKEIIQNRYEAAQNTSAIMWRGMFQGKSIEEGTIQQGNKKLNEKRIHPTQKPVNLYRWIVQKYIEKGWKVLDTHVGSASSLIAYEEYGLDYVGFEKDRYYYDLANKRLQEHRAQLTVFDFGIERMTM